MSLTIAEDTKQERHSRKCKVCNHKKRKEMEEDYLRWRPVKEILAEYTIPERSFYRHTQALGLDEKKHKNRRRYYLKIMERASLNNVRVSEALAAAKLLEQVEGKLPHDQEGLHTPEERSKEYEGIAALVRRTETEVDKN